MGWGYQSCWQCWWHQGQRNVLNLKGTNFISMFPTVIYDESWHVRLEKNLIMHRLSSENLRLIRKCTPEKTHMSKFLQSVVHPVCEKRRNPHWHSLSLVCLEWVKCRRESFWHCPNFPPGPSIRQVSLSSWGGRSVGRSSSVPPASTTSAWPLADRTKIDGMLQIHLLKRHRFESLSVFKKGLFIVLRRTESDLPNSPKKDN